MRPAPKKKMALSNGFAVRLDWYAWGFLLVSNKYTHNETRRKLDKTVIGSETETFRLNQKSPLITQLENSTSRLKFWNSEFNNSEYNSALTVTVNESRSWLILVGQLVASRGYKARNCNADTNVIKSILLEAVLREEIMFKQRAARRHTTNATTPMDMLGSPHFLQ
jgi:hypothetical protein